MEWTQSALDINLFSDGGLFSKGFRVDRVSARHHPCAAPCQASTMSVRKSLAQRGLHVKFDPGIPTALAATDIDARDLTGNWSTVKQKINSIQADLRGYETPC